MCDGQAAGDCDVMNLTEFKTALNDRLTNLNDQFLTLNDVLAAKKEDFIELYRTDPRISLDESISYLQTAMEAFDPAQPQIDERNSLRAQLAQLQEIAAEAEEIRLRQEKTQQEKTNLEHHFYELQSKLSGAEKQNGELQSVLDSLKLERSNLERDKSDVSRLLQETQARLRDAESAEIEQTRRIKELEKIKICDKFSNHTKNITISLPKRGFFKSKGWSVKYNYNNNSGGAGYCFLNHPNLGTNEILKWSFRVPKSRYTSHSCSKIGMVIIL